MTTVLGANSCGGTRSPHKDRRNSFYVADDPAEILLIFR
jgi:hypothetical protein